MRLTPEQEIFLEETLAGRGDKTIVEQTQGMMWSLPRFMMMLTLGTQVHIEAAEIIYYTYLRHFQALPDPTHDDIVMHGEIVRLVRDMYDCMGRSPPTLDSKVSA